MRPSPSAPTEDIVGRRCTPTRKPIDVRPLEGPNNWSKSVFSFESGPPNGLDSFDVAVQSDSGGRPFHRRSSHFRQSSNSAEESGSRELAEKNAETPSVDTEGDCERGGNRTHLFVCMISRHQFRCRRGTLACLNHSSAGVVATSEFISEVSFGSISRQKPS